MQQVKTMSIRDVLFGYYGTQCLNTVIELGVVGHPFSKNGQM